VILVALVKIQRSVNVKPGLATNRRLMVLHVTLLILVVVDGSFDIVATDKNTLFVFLKYIMNFCIAMFFIYVLYLENKPLVKHSVP